MKASVILTIWVSVMISACCYAQDGNFNNLSFNQLTKGGGAADILGWGLNLNPEFDVRPNSVDRPALLINHHYGLTFSAHSYYGGFRFYNQGYPGNPLNPANGAAMVMSINNNAVGIATTNPRVPFDVGADITDGKLGAVLGRLHEGDNDGEGTFLGVRGYGTVSNGKSFALEHSFYGATNSSINFYRGNAIIGGYMSFNTSSNIERMRIDQNGNVGIGTASPNVKLAVNGNIRAHEIKVELANWPDYVFTKGYELPTLQETEKHIKDKGRLPGIPSAGEVKANGIDLGEMNAKLLQKIEELTLYILEQNKRLQRLETNQDRCNHK